MKPERASAIFVAGKFRAAEIEAEENATNFAAAFTIARRIRSPHPGTE